MIRTLLYIAVATILTTSLAMSGCSRKTDTHDPDHVPKSETEVMEEVIITKPENSGSSDAAMPVPSVPDNPAADPSAQETSPPPATTGSAESPNGEGELICTPEWFNWVNEQVMNDQGDAIAEQFPNGLPEVGSADWYNAVDRLTGGDGAHGPDGGSDEWCFMLQQRLSKRD